MADNPAFMVTVGWCRFGFDRFLVTDADNPDEAAGGPFAIPHAVFDVFVVAHDASSPR